MDESTNSTIVQNETVAIATTTELRKHPLYAQVSGMKPDIYRVKRLTLKFRLILKTTIKQLCTALPQRDIVPDLFVIRLVFIKRKVFRPLHMTTVEQLHKGKNIHTSLAPSTSKH